MRCVVICSKNVTFAVATTIAFMSDCLERSCDLLKKCYLCSSNNNEARRHSFEIQVVICSKNVTFAVATTICCEFYLLLNSCDLLKKCYLCSSNNNIFVFNKKGGTVVICSKNVTFAVATTILTRTD